MAHGGDKRVGPYHHIVADKHLANVEDGEVEIAGEVVADEYVFTAVAAERL